MSIESDADRLAMIKACGGEQVDMFEDPYTTTVYAIVDKDFVEVNGVECERPVALVRTSDITNGDPNYAVVHGSNLSTGTGDYFVIGIQPDGQGMTLLVMQDQ